MSGVSFGGVPCAQQWSDFILWEAVLNERLDLQGIVELGTFKGGFSLWLYAQCKVRDMWFRTYDVIHPGRRIPGFVQIDMYLEKDEICRYLSKKPGPIILFCDGGNKPREMKTFPQCCPEGSLFFVHDWGTETLLSDIPSSLRMVYGDYCEQLRSITRVFEKA